MDARVAPLEAQAPGAASEPWPAARSAWYAVFMLALGTMFAELDLRVVALLVEPMKRDLHLSDSKMALLLGLAFAVFYTFIGLPLARFVDRRSRKVILALGIATWSIATACCGVAQNFSQLFLSRVFVGAGESVNGPATFSLISDYFPRDRLPRAIATMQIGVVAGGGFALLIGAFVIHMLANVPPIELAGGVVIHNWQLVFIAVGLPGLLVAALVATTLNEPQRRGVSLGVRDVPFREVVRYLYRQRSVFAPMFLGLALGSLSLGTRMWSPAFYQRTYGWQPARIGALTGVMQLVLTPIGLFLGVWLAERLIRRQYVDAPLRVVIITRLIGMPATILGPLMPNPWLALAADGLGLMAIAMGGACQNAALQIVTPNRMRGQVTALYMFIFSVIGVGLGPNLVAAITDFVFRNESQLRYSLVLTSILVVPTSLAITWLGVKPYRLEVARLRSLEP